MRRAEPANWSNLPNRNRPRFYTAWVRLGNDCQSAPCLLSPWKRAPLRLDLPRFREVLSVWDQAVCCPPRSHFSVPACTMPWSSRGAGKRARKFVNVCVLVPGHT